MHRRRNSLLKDKAATNANIVKQTKSNGYELS